MGMFNILEMEFYCPKYQHTSKTEVEFNLGFLNLDKYKIGDKLIWGDDFMRKTRIENRRPNNGNYIGEGYVECPNCNQDYFLKIISQADVIL
jgi:hypothetical protein